MISKVKKATGLKINLITGLKEAKIIAKGNRLSKLDYNKTYLYVDVGGGSTEYSILKKGANKKSKSFKFGTVRLLNKLDLSHTKNEIASWLTSNIDFNDKIKLFATGGNINKTHKILGAGNGEPISRKAIEKLHEKLSHLSLEKRISKFQLRCSLSLLTLQKSGKTTFYSSVKTLLSLPCLVTIDKIYLLRDSSSYFGSVHVIYGIYG